MRNKAFIGIDPGKTGAMALISADTYMVEDYPGDPAGVTDIMRRWLLEYEINLAALEKVGARSGQGVVSMFTFGQNLGAYQGALAALGISYTMPTPRTWQKGLVDQKAGPDPKTRSLVTARRLFPNAELHLKKHHGRADALLLAWWARQQMAN